MKPYQNGIHSHHQLDAAELIKIIEEKKDGQRTNSGSISINTGKFTGRSPKDRFIVEESITKEKVNWGKINLPISPENY
ncbi:MAG: phosphoenolpyruvate carboxykinase (ATP), partial [Christiangramia sp.]